MSNHTASRIRGERLVKYSIITPPFLFLLMFFLFPALIMVVASFRFPGEFGGLAPLFRTEDGTGGLTLENYRLFFSSSNYAWIFLRSFGVAALTTVICLFMAYPVATLIARSPKKSRDLLVLLCVLPFASNFLVRVYAWMIIFQPFNMMHSRLAVIVGMVYVHLPFMILPLYTNLEKHDPTLLDAAQDLGANAWQRFWRVTFPMSLPGIFSGAVLVFIPVLGMFAIPEILGGKDDWLVGNMIKEAFLGARDWPFGSMLSMIMTITVLMLVALSAWFARKGVYRA
ncbi:MAG: ABC transporter permease [Burkholderiales bacterium]|jgi:spermidine/putrescine transport system permease protein|nr:ABC transporter permease [Burkholderiales bacterium]